jgi:DNA (cytosine-5)-methyltransferase 1
MRKLNVATLFSGIGAFEFALKRLNIDHDIVFAVDNGNINISIDIQVELKKVLGLNSPLEKKTYVDELYNKSSRKKNYVKTSYLANYNIKEENYFYDIRLFDAKPYLNKIDILVGGSPCQSFSTIGSKSGLEDARGTLFYDFARVIKESKPKVFIFENVRGLFTHDKGKTWEVIKGIFDSLGYSYKYDVLNAVDFNIPQNRRRLFVVGFLNSNKDFVFPKKKKLEYKMQDFLISKESEGGFNFGTNGELSFKNKPGNIDNKYFLTEKLVKYVMSTGTKSFYTKNEINLSIARTILSTMGNRHRAGVDNYVTEKGKIRMLSEREALRLMGFTDDFKIVVSRAQMYKQAGNSIVVDVFMALIKEILKVM